MNFEDKINEIHEAVIEMRADYRADREICNKTHSQVDARLDGLHRIVKGNGSKGLEQKHDDLRNEFSGFKAQVIAYATVGSAIGGFVINLIFKSEMLQKLFP